VVEPGEYAIPKMTLPTAIGLEKGSQQTRDESIVQKMPTLSFLIFLTGVDPIRMLLQAIRESKSI
jgi:hypothetical protein